MLKQSAELIAMPSTKEWMLLNCGTGKDSCRVPWTARRSNQCILKEINPEYSLKRLMLCGSQQTGRFLEMEIQDHLTCLLRNLYAGQEPTVRTGHGTIDWFQIKKGICQGCILSPCLFNVYAEYIMRNAGLEEAQAGIKIAGRKSITSDMQMTPPLWQKVKRN